MKNDEGIPSRFFFILPIPYELMDRVVSPGLLEAVIVSAQGSNKASELESQFNATVNHQCLTELNTR